MRGLVRAIVYSCIGRTQSIPSESACHAIVRVSTREYDVLIYRALDGWLVPTWLQAAVDSGVKVDAIVNYLERNAHPAMATQTPVSYRTDRSCIGRRFTFALDNCAGRPKDGWLTRRSRCARKVCLVYMPRKLSATTVPRLQVLPETVVNQIHLWAKERERITANACKLYDRFDTLDAFDTTVTYAKEIGVYLWSRRYGDAQQALKCMLAVKEDGHAAIKRFLAASR